MPSKRRTRSRRVAAATDLVPLERDDAASDPPPAWEVAPDAVHAVYFITDEFMRPLYIGSTSNLMRRLREHAKARDWFTPTCRVFAEWFRDRDDAALREAHAIFETRPAHNRRLDKPTQPPPEPDVALRPLVDLDRDIAGLCANCRTERIHASGLCGGCYNFRLEHGVDRPSAA